MDPIVKAEFVALLDTMTADEIKKYRHRILTGHFEGGYYVGKNCGCAYGTWAYVTGLANPHINYLSDRNDSEFSRLEDLIKNYIPVDAYITPLEKYVLYVHGGDKPKDSIVLDNLVNEIDLYLKEKSNV